MGKGNSFAHGINGNSGSSNSGPDSGQVEPLQHGDFCVCIWCLQGVR